MHKVFYGKGVLDIEWEDRLSTYFLKWKDMLQRCYCKKLHKKFPTYKNCEVSEDWLTFSSFLVWIKDQEELLGSLEGLYLDKDLKFTNNTLYSENTCILVDSKVNNFFHGINVITQNKNLPVGASYTKNKQRYQARSSDPIRGVRVYLGTYDTPEEANHAWCDFKLKLLDEFYINGSLRQTSVYTNMRDIIESYRV